MIASGVWNSCDATATNRFWALNADSRRPYVGFYDEVRPNTSPLARGTRKRSLRLLAVTLSVACITFDNGGKAIDAIA